MRNTQHHLRSAPIAIAAMLALGSTPAFAQTAPEASPTAQTSNPIVLKLPVAPPTAAPSPAPAAPVTATPTVQPVPKPTIVLDVPPAPAEAESQADESAPMQSAKPAPAEAAQSESAPQRSEAAPRAEATASEPAPVAAPMAGGSDTPISSPAETSLPADEAVAAAPAPVVESAAVDPAPDIDRNWVALIALALVGLIPIGLAFLAFAWFRRRTHRAGELDMETVVCEPAPVPTAPSASVPVEAAAEPVAEPEPAPVRDDVVRADRELPAPSLPATGAAVPLPAELPESFEERDALLKRMIAARPDRANPFRSTKARARRARLILQSLGRRFDNVKPRIDLSEYAANWPTLARRRTTSYA